METLVSRVWNYLGQLHMPSIRWTDIAEIIIIAFLLYHVLLWFRNTRAWSLLKGLVIIALFIVVAELLNMTTIIWMVQNVASIAIMAFVIILQPELRSAMEELGQKNFLNDVFHISFQQREEGLFTDKTVNEIVRACISMARVKTGALIVIEQTTPLHEYERTGIDIDAIVTSQLLINIFEKNTPLHDGAVIIRGDRVTSATCYLPLTDNRLDKDLGTRHRAAVGISDVTDSLTIIVSEETGGISVAYKGQLSRSLDADQLRARLTELQGKTQTDDGKHGFFRKGRGTNEE